MHNTAPRVKALIDEGPDFGASTREPSLRAVLRAHYTPWFGRDEADGLADRYVDAVIAALEPQEAEPVGDEQAIIEAAAIQALEWEHLKTTISNAKAGTAGPITGHEWKVATTAARIALSHAACLKRSSAVPASEKAVDAAVVEALGWQDLPNTVALARTGQAGPRTNQRWLDATNAARIALSHPVQGWQECATEGCCSPATVHFERGGIGSHYCHSCYMRVQALPAGPAAKETAQNPEGSLCSDCPPKDYPTDKTRCDPCPRRPAKEGQ
ncbi:hypothetical protein [Rhizobiales bacterium 3FA27D7]|jgi:hypothetical protein|uniref:hypothetical protein n=1 Tax=Mesorhizobium sp. 2RAF21 TaxID=3232995 RepID=UPI0010F7E565